MIDRSTIDRVIERAEIADVVGDFVTLHRKGKDYIGLCPFHEDSRPSFSVSVSRNICKCFACGEGGNPVSFVMKHEHMTFPEAIRYLAHKYGIPVEEREQSPEEERERSEREKLINANSFARDVFVRGLHQDGEGRRVGLSYFRERGLTEETIKTFELGYSPTRVTYMVDAIREGGQEMTTFETVGVVMRTRQGDYVDRYRDRVIYPIHSISGNVVGFGGRILVKKENTGKYINSPASSLYDKSRELYGMYFAKREISKVDKCLVVEGYMDVLSMHQRGIRYVVASSGTALTHEQVQLIKRYTSNVTYIFDSDAAGVKAALRGIDIGLEKSMNVRVVLLPEGEDPDSYAQAHSKETVEEYIREHEVDGLHFKADRLLGESDAGPQARAEVVAQLAESLAYIPDQLVREIYVQDIAQLMGVTVAHLTERVERIRWDRTTEQARSREIERARAERIEAEAAEHSGVSTVPHARESEGHQPVKNVQSQPEVPTEVSHRKPTKTIQNPLLPNEESLLHYIMSYGADTVESYQKRNMEEGAKIIEIIQEQTMDLRRKGVLSKHFVQILDEIVERIDEQPQLSPRDYLAWHEDPTISHYANRELMNDYKLSERHRSFERDQSNPDDVKDRVMQEILSYKYDVVLTQISDVLKEIRALSDEEHRQSGEEVVRLLEHLSRLNDTKKAMAQMLGERVINPLARIYRK